MRVFKKFFIILNILTALATVLVYLTSFYHPQKLWIFSTVGLLYPMLFFINCFFILYWLFQDVKWMILSALVVIAGWNYTTGFIGVNNSKYTPEQKDIGILSYNTHFFAGATGTNNDFEITEVLSFFERLKPLDFICLQEFHNQFKFDFLNHFKGYRFISVDNKRTAILSRHPVLASGEIDFGTRTNSCVWADVVMDDDTVRIYTMHLRSNNITKETDNVLENIDLQERSTWRGARNIISKYRRTAIQRAEQARMVKASMDRSPYPVIVAGDFNEPPSSYTYNLMMAGMQDSFRKQGNGIGSTYAGRIPFLRIDYILAELDFEVAEYEVFDVPYSDHYPVYSVLRIKP